MLPQNKDKKNKQIFLSFSPLEHLDADERAVITVMWKILLTLFFLFFSVYIIDLKCLIMVIFVLRTRQDPL